MLDSFVNRRIADFLIQERIGKGGQGVVYRALQLSVKRPVALKLIDISGEPDDTERIRRRFLQEVEVLVSLEHIHILPLYAFGFFDGTSAFMAMRLMRGGSLRDRLQRGALPLNQALTVFAQIAQGLSYAHSRGVIHRDLKPSNILFDDSENAYLTDFGLARLINPLVEPSSQGEMIGTPAYIAPDQLGERPSDHRADIYSLGVILYEMLTGRLPFDSGSNHLAVLYKHLKEDPIPPRHYEPNIPPKLETIVMRALQKQPERRYYDAADMLDDIASAVDLRIRTGSYPAFRAEPERATALVSAPALASQQMIRPAALIAALILLMAVAVFVSRDSLRQSRSIILADEVSQPLEIIPSDAEITRARQTLGDRGFIAFLNCADEGADEPLAREIGIIAERYDLPYRVFDAGMDSYIQRTQLEQALLEGAKAFIVCPLEAGVSTSIVTALNREAVPFTSLLPVESDSGVGLDLRGYQVGFDAGARLGEMLGAEDQENAVVLLDGSGVVYIQPRLDGLISGFTSVAEDAEIVGAYAGYTEAQAQSAIRRLLDAGIPFNVVLCATALGAVGAARALEAAGTDPRSVMIAAIGTSPALEEYLNREQYVRVSVPVDMPLIARAALDATVKLLAGASIAGIIEIPSGESGNSSPPSAQLPPV